MFWGVFFFFFFVSKLMKYVWSLCDYFHRTKWIWYRRHNRIIRNMSMAKKCYANKSINYACAEGKNEASHRNSMHYSLISCNDWPSVFYQMQPLWVGWRQRISGQNVDLLSFCQLSDKMMPTHAIQLDTVTFLYVFSVLSPVRQHITNLHQIHFVPNDAHLRH